MSTSTAWYTDIHVTKHFPLGTRKRAASGNEYVYLAGIASLAAGDFVAWNYTQIAARSLDSTLTPGRVGVSQVANVTTTNYSWFQVVGPYATAAIATHSSGAGLGLFASSSAGQATTTPATEKVIFGAWSGGNSASNVGPVYLANPFIQGDVST